MQRRPRWFEGAPLRRALPWLCGLVAAAIAAKNLVGGYGDLGIYLDVAREFRAGGFDLCRDRPSSGPWVYPHFAALPFAALHATMDDAAIRWLWSALLGVATALLLSDLARAVRAFGGLRWWQWLVFAFLFQRCIAQNLTHGQLSLWIGAFVLRGIVRLQEGREVGAGLWLGLAAALKLTPLLFLAALPLMRMRRAGAAMLGTVLVAVLIAPWPFCGTAEHLRHLGDFWHTIAGSLADPASATISAARAGPSIGGTFDHLLQPRPIDKDGRTVNVLTVSDDVLLAVKLTWSLLLATLLLAWFRRARSAALAQRLAMQAGAVLLAMSLFAPLLRVYHLAAVLLPCALFCRGPRDRRDVLFWATAAAFALALTLRQKNLLGETLWRTFDAGGLLHFALVAMLVWLWRDARSHGQGT